MGVETPEFAFEKEASNVENAIEQFGIRYPVVQDNEMGTWNAYGNEYWPADYLIDANGDVRYATVGEGDYAQTETAIRALLAEAGRERRRDGTSRPTSSRRAKWPRPRPISAPTARRAGVNGPQSGLHDYGTSRARPIWPSTNSTYSGTWNIAAQPADSRLERWDRHGVRGQERVSGAQLRRRTATPGAGAARRQADTRRVRRGRRARRRR